MTSRFFVLALALAATLGSALDARAQQRVCITGTVQVAGGPSVCGQVFTHQLDCTRVALRSNVVNLNQFVGQNVKLIGRNVGVSCPLIEVQQVVPPPATLQWCGSPSLGCGVKLKVCPVGIGQWALYCGFQTGYVPVGCSNLPNGVDGTWLLGGQVFALGGGATGGPCGEVLLPIPLDNSLVGLQVFFQGLRRDIGPVGPVQLTNAECFTIQPFSPACVVPNC